MLAGTHSTRLFFKKNPSGVSDAYVSEAPQLPTSALLSRGKFGLQPGIKILTKAHKTKCIKISLK